MTKFYRFFSLNIEQRRTLRAWALAASGPAFTGVLLLLVYVMAWHFAGFEDKRIDWLGYIAMGVIALLFVPVLAYAVETGIRSFKTSVGKDGASVEVTADGEDNPAKATAVEESS